MVIELQSLTRRDYFIKIFAQLCIFGFVYTNHLSWELFVKISTENCVTEQTTTRSEVKRNRNCATEVNSRKSVRYLLFVCWFWCSERCVERRNRFCDVTVIQSQHKHQRRWSYTKVKSSGSNLDEIREFDQFRCVFFRCLMITWILHLIYLFISQ